MSTRSKNSIASDLLFSTLLLVASLVAVDASKASERTTNMKIRISIADKVVIATVADNATARDFVSVLPLSVSMKDLFGREKYGDLPKALSENGPRKNTYEVGEIAYWSPSHQFAVYYHQDGESIPLPGVIPIAKIDAGVEAFNVPGSVKVTVAVAK
jgi:hypothetical protein